MGFGEARGVAQEGLSAEECAARQPRTDHLAQTVSRRRRPNRHHRLSCKRPPPTATALGPLLRSADRVCDVTSQEMTKSVGQANERAHALQHKLVEELYKQEVLIHTLTLTRTLTRTLTLTSTQ
jgi:hypothetical protein